MYLANINRNEENGSCCLKAVVLTKQNRTMMEINTSSRSNRSNTLTPIRRKQTTRIMMYAKCWISSILLVLAAVRSVESFVAPSHQQSITSSTRWTTSQPRQQRSNSIYNQERGQITGRISPCPAMTSTALCVSRYGPPSETSSFPSNKNNNNDDSDNNNNDNVDFLDFEGTKEEEESLETRQRKSEFRTLLETCLTTTKEEHLPKILGQNIELVMSLHGQEGAQVVAELVQEAQQEGEVQYTQTVEMVEYILTFCQDFVEQAISLDDHNKQLLGKIIRAMTGTKDGQITEGVTPIAVPPSAREKEDLLDLVLQDERDNFTPGFLRHIEGECHRIASAPKMTPDSARLLEILRMIQTRVLEELGQDMGEAAVVLGQLMGYDNDNELIAVLEAGLTVRGMDFAKELKALTVEALDGFRRVPKGVGVEEELVERVTLVDKRLASYLEEQNKFQ